MKIIGKLLEVTFSRVTCVLVTVTLVLSMVTLSAEGSVVTNQQFRLLSSVSSQTNMITYKFDQGQSDPKLGLCQILFVAGGIILIGVGGCKLKACIDRLKTNINKKITTLTNDILSASMPPNMLSGVGVSNTNIGKLVLPDDMKLMYMDVKPIVYDLSSDGLMIGDKLVKEEIVTPVYPTNIVAVDPDGVMRSCSLEYSKDMELWRPFVGPNGTVLLDRNWYGYDQRDLSRPVCSLSVSYLGGIPCGTNYSAVSFNAYGIEETIPLAVFADLPKVPGAEKCFWRLRIGQ